MNTPEYPHASDVALMGIDDAARRLGVSSASIRRAIARGDLRTVRIGRRVLIETSEIKRLVTAAGGQA